MVTPSSIADFVSEFMASMPPQWQALNADMKAEFQRCLQNSLQKLSLVTREEFDVQSEVLAKTRAKLEMLEEKLR